MRPDFRRQDPRIAPEASRGENNGRDATTLAIGVRECGLCRAERIAYCGRARPLKSSGRSADGSIPMSRNGGLVYSGFFQQSSFASFAVAPAKDVIKIRRDALIEMLGPLGCGCRPAPVRCSM
jgi:Zn-dependent alcohol dehydrogenase